MIYSTSTIQNMTLRTIKVYISVTKLLLAGYPLRGNLICMKYRIIILIISIISLGEYIIIVYCKHIMHALTHARTHVHAHAQYIAHRHARTRACLHVRMHIPLSPFRFDGSMAPKRHGANAPFRLFRWHSWPVAGSFK